MPEIDPDARPFINEGFARRVETIDPPVLEVIVQTEPGAAQEVAQRLAGREFATVDQSGIIANQFVPVSIPEEAINQLALVEGVQLVHQDQPVSIQMVPRGTGPLPFLRPDANPVQNVLSEALFEAFMSDDPFVGRTRISEVEVPQVNFAQIPPGDPIQTAASLFDSATGANTTGEKLIPTSQSVSWLRDSNVTAGSNGSDTKAAIIDTGLTPVEPSNGPRVPVMESYVPGEPPTDGLGHGTWCSYMVAGRPAPSLWGTVEGVAQEAQFGHFKALNTFPGFGKTSWILRAMDRANQWGADIISMSLGGAQQGPVGQDPFCSFIRQTCKENAGDEDGSIYVVAAGNSGPGSYTIGSPGVAEKALTVASWSLTDDSPAVFSSRGPQGDFYADTQDAFQRDMGEYGASEFVKPDVAAPGGGRENAEKAEQQDELLHQSEFGWMEGLYDGFRDFRGSMKGTSMACPAAAGLVVRLYEAGIIETAAEVKQVVSDRQSVPQFPDAAGGANAVQSGKNIAIGFGPLRESLFQPAE